MPGINVSEFPLLISPEVQHEISELYTFSYNILKRKTDKSRILLGNFIKDQLDFILHAQDDEGNKTNAQSKLVLLKEGKKRIEVVLKNSNSFTQYFKQVEKLGLGLVLCDSFIQDIDMFVTVEKIRNMYKRDKKDQDAQGEKEFFLNIKMGLTHGVQQYNDLIRKLGSNYRGRKK